MGFQSLSKSIEYQIFTVLARISLHITQNIYVSVGGAQEAYGSRLVSLSVCISKSRFSTMLEN